MEWIIIGLCVGIGLILAPIVFNLILLIVAFVIGAIYGLFGDK